MYFLQAFAAHLGGVNCVRWASIDTTRMSLGDGSILTPTKRLATCGVDGLVMQMQSSISWRVQVAIWMCQSDMQWIVEEKLCGKSSGTED